MSKSTVKVGIDKSSKVVLFDSTEECIVVVDFGENNLSGSSTDGEVSLLRVFDFLGGLKSRGVSLEGSQESNLEVVIVVLADQGCSEVLDASDGGVIDIVDQAVGISRVL